jgi:hypothetical protein
MFSDSTGKRGLMMRSPGVVYKKLKEVKYRHLISMYRKFFRKIPENCKYNKKYEFMVDGEIREVRLCMLHQDKDGINPELLDLCEQLHHSSRCDGFILRYTKDDIKTLFEQEMSDKSIKEKRYPDICALEWVLERSAPGSVTWPQRLWHLLKKQRNK